MKVKCVRLLDEAGLPIDQSPWLEIGKIYHVLAINISADGVIRYVIESGCRPDEFPSLSHHRSQCFEIISTKVPSNWSTWLEGTGHIGISPMSWQIENFAIDLAENNPLVLDRYLQERDQIFNEDP